MFHKVKIGVLTRCLKTPQKYIIGDVICGTNENSTFSMTSIFLFVGIGRKRCSTSRWRMYAHWWREVLCPWPREFPIWSCPRDVKLWKRFPFMVAVWNRMIFMGWRYCSPWLKGARGGKEGAWCWDKRRPSINQQTFFCCCKEREQQSKQKKNTHKNQRERVKREIERKRNRKRRYTINIYICILHTFLFRNIIFFN